MDLTFQVPMQYCSLQHRTLLPSPVPSTPGCCFCSCSVSSFFLELLLYSPPGAYWAPTDLGSSSFSVLSVFHTVHEVLKARILKCFAIPFYSGPCFVRNLRSTFRKRNHGIQSHHFMANRWGDNGNSERLYLFIWLQNHCRL